MKLVNLFKNLNAELDIYDNPKSFGYTAVNSNLTLNLFAGWRVGDYGIARYRVTVTSAISSATSVDLITMDIEKDPDVLILGQYTLYRNQYIIQNYVSGISGKSIRELGNGSLQVNDSITGFVIFHIPK